MTGVQAAISPLASSITEADGVPALAVQLSVRGLNFYYGRYQALIDVSMDVYKERVTAFIGPSG